MEEKSSINPAGDSMTLLKVCASYVAYLALVLTGVVFLGYVFLGAAEEGYVQQEAFAAQAAK